MAKKKYTAADVDSAPLDPEWIIREIVVAIAAHDRLVDALTLKGGNALRLIHAVGDRRSADVDWSLRNDDDATDLEAQLRAAITGRFDSLEVEIFDIRFEKKPPVPGPNPKWGGYWFGFKAVRRGHAKTIVQAELIRLSKKRPEDILGGLSEAQRLEAIRRNAPRVYEIEISMNEVTEGRTVAACEGYTVHVYTLEMIGAEKLRALCQQMAEYGLRKNPAPRSRDFYDIHAIVTEGKADLLGKEELIKQMFAAKDVPLRLLGLLANYRDFHRQDWARVCDAIPATANKDFELYFEFVLGVVKRLKPLWDVDTPPGI